MNRPAAPSARPACICVQTLGFASVSSEQMDSSTLDVVRAGDPDRGGAQTESGGGRERRGGSDTAAVATRMDGWLADWLAWLSLGVCARLTVVFENIETDGARAVDVAVCWSRPHRASDRR